MKTALDLVVRVAEHRTTVLITGESGTGKEVIARAIHRASPRSSAAFIGINCAAIPENLLESELFGHMRGAFTGASADKAGLFEQAEGGTLLLDEIGELPLGLQAKLLRVLQESEIRRVGDQRTRRVDVRLLATTARSLSAEAEAGRFRDDLFYRLNVVTIHLPPLDQRREDIVPLARHFAAQLGERFGHPLDLTDDALTWLAEQPWPGNVRELEHAIERAAVLSDRETLSAVDFRDQPGAPGRAPGRSAGTLRGAVDAAERVAIAAALAASDGNRREAARHLGISVRSLFYKMQRLGID
jgi:two-component system response regulator AtoC